VINTLAYSSGLSVWVKNVFTRVYHSNFKFVLCCISKHTSLLFVTAVKCIIESAPFDVYVFCQFKMSTLIPLPFCPNNNELVNTLAYSSGLSVWVKKFLMFSTGVNYSNSIIDCSGIMLYFKMYQLTVCYCRKMFNNSGPIWCICFLSIQDEYSYTVSFLP